MVALDINRKAPATASAEAVILAPLNVVWSVLTKIDEWSRWNPDVSRVELRNPLTPGTEFHWKTGSGASNVSTLQEVEPERRVAWTGRTLGIRAVHVWTFAEQDGGVLVRSEESFDGFIFKVVLFLKRYLEAIVPLRWLEKGKLRTAGGRASISARGTGGPLLTNPLMS